MSRPRPSWRPAARPYRSGTMQPSIVSCASSVQHCAWPGAPSLTPGSASMSLAILEDAHPPEALLMRLDLGRALCVGWQLVVRWREPPLVHLSSVERGESADIRLLLSYAAAMLAKGIGVHLPCSERGLRAFGLCTSESLCAGMPVGMPPASGGWSWHAMPIRASWAH